MIAQLNSSKRNKYGVEVITNDVMNSSRMLIWENMWDATKETLIYDWYFCSCNLYFRHITRVIAYS